MVAITNKNSMQNNSIATEGRLELLLFSLGDAQPFGMNVLKVKEIIPCPRLTAMPKSHPCVIGVAELRGTVLPVIDLSQALGRGRLEDRDKCSLIVTELNRSLQAFLIGGVQRIVEREWKDVLPPPKGSGRTYVSGVTHVENRMIQILDVERVLWEVIPPDDSESDQALEALEKVDLQGAQVLVVDDSSMARLQTRRTLERIGVPCIMVRDGLEALEYLKGLVAKGRSVVHDIPMVISDIEMPEMDGYSLTEAIRAEPGLADLYVLLHTSLNGSISEEQALRVGADAALTKFVAEELAKETIAGLKKQAAA